MAFYAFTTIKHVLKLTGITESSRRYVKPLIRRPLAAFSVNDSNEFHKKKSNILVPKTKGEKQLFLQNANGLRYTFLKDGDERFGYYIQRANKNRNENIKNPKIVLEGVRLIADAISENVVIKCIYFTKKELLNVLPVDRLTSSTELYKVNEKEMNIWSETSCSSGLLAVACQPKVPSLYDPILPVKLVLDGINDEGQVGTLIRSAAAAGVEKVYITPSTTDPWSPKVLRSAMGGHFHVPVIRINSHFLEGYACNAACVYVLEHKQGTTQCNQENQTISNQISTVRFDKLNFKKNSMLMIGSAESHKFFHNIKENISYIMPMPGFGTFGAAVDGSVILYEMKRQHNNVS